MWFDIIKLDREYLRSLREKGYEVPKEMTIKPIDQINKVVEWVKEWADGKEIRIPYLGLTKTLNRKQLYNPEGYSPGNPPPDATVPYTPPSRPIKEYNTGAFAIMTGDIPRLIIYGPRTSRPAFDISFVRFFNKASLASAISNSNAKDALWRILDMELATRIKDKLVVPEFRAGGFMQSILDSLPRASMDNEGNLLVTGESGNEYRFNYWSGQDCHVEVLNKKLIKPTHAEIEEHAKKSIMSNQPNYEERVDSETQRILQVVKDFPYTIKNLKLCIKPGDELRNLPKGDKYAAMLLMLHNDVTQGRGVITIKAVTIPWDINVYGNSPRRNNWFSTTGKIIFDTTAPSFIRRVDEKASTISPPW